MNNELKRERFPAEILRCIATRKVEIVNWKVTLNGKHASRYHATCNATIHTIHNTKKFFRMINNY